MGSAAKAVIWTVLAVLAGGGFAAWGADNPHHAAAQCKLGGDYSCNGVCLYCHLPPAEDLNIYVTGDSAICGTCHESAAFQTATGTFLLKNLGGNHPSQIYYNEGADHDGFNRDPAGPKLYCDPSGGNCKVLCSTCHDPMNTTVNLLRVNNRGSALCLSCHRK